MRVVGISASLKATSSTAAVLASVGELVVQAHGADAFGRYDGLESLPHFNPDRDEDPPLQEVAEWRATLDSADAVVIATPEYAHSFPGVLKDALDWVVGSGELVDKPVLLVTASGGGGVRAGEALAPVLRAMSAKVVGPVSIWGVTPKILDGRLADAADLRTLAEALRTLAGLAGA